MQNNGSYPALNNVKDILLFQRLDMIGCGEIFLVKDSSEESIHRKCK